MTVLHTYEQELESEAIPELISEDMILLVRYSYFKRQPQFFDHAAGVGGPEEPASIEFYDAKVRTSKGQLIDLALFPSLSDALVPQSLLDSICENHSED